MPLPAILGALAGPVLIASSVLFQLRAFAFGGLITSDHEDVLAFWLPNYCLMGKTIAAGHVPVWNPFAMTGVPLAADPQSGWMSFVPMLLFPAVSCGTAIAWLIVAMPIVAGIGLYSFLRSEGVSRSASTVGGLSIALAMASSHLVTAVPFAAALAWATVALWAASRMMRAVDRPERFAWVAATSLAWGQVVAAHPSHGQLIGSGALASFLLVKGICLVRARGIRWRSLLVLGAVLIVSLFAVNLAILLPRAMYFTRTELSLGYQVLQPLQDGFEAQTASGASWPLKLSVSPGAYLGAIVLILAGGGFWSRRWRHLSIAFAAFAAVYYVLSVDVVFRVMAPILRGVPLADQLYVHHPWRFGLALFLALPILGAIGFESWLQQPRDARVVRFWMVLPGLAVWVVGTAVMMSPGMMGLFAAGLVVGGALLARMSRTMALVGLLPIVLAVELLVNGTLGLTWQQPPEGAVDDVFDTRFPYGPLLRPTIPVDRYLEETRFVGPIRASGRRYLSISHRHPVAPPFWAGLLSSRSVLFGIEEGNGYNPAQPIRYWRFVRAVNQGLGKRPGKYNSSIVRGLSPSAVDLLDVGWVVSPGRVPDGQPWLRRVDRDRGWVLSRVERPLGRASIPARWVVLGGAEALERVADPTFDPAGTVILEEDPGVRAAFVEHASAQFEWTGLASARVAVSTPADAVVLIRNGYDPNWHATVDGREQPVLVGDYFLQAVPVPAGSHTIALRYDDPWVGLGTAGSVVALLSLAGLTIGLRRYEARVR